MDIIDRAEWENLLQTAAEIDKRIASAKLRRDIHSQKELWKKRAEISKRIRSPKLRVLGIDA